MTFDLLLDGGGMNISNGEEVMASRLRVDPIDLRMSADHMDMHRADLAAAHTAADDAIEGAQAGWVGTSAAALQAKFVEWQATTTKLCDDVAAHGAAYTAAADGYSKNDVDSAEAVNRTL
ncbi:WXG100 family type VII secretion target [Mycobacterium yunnanensis]|uniref:WXG100 family type VII secretion target n=1 Tax=Mycobacterium yunnanensis TaxID=368477 RepID=A0A9X2YX86_9MYCO|nr:WXG100 family type VII secretion target [Mycobacterium yunnanensis]MCV7419321.1 WXG100 family type VII secretion target [Mycobacterium yunnanensis]